MVLIKPDKNGYKTDIQCCQVLRLGSDLEDQVKKGESLEARASEAEKSLLELTQKLDHVSTISTQSGYTVVFSCFSHVCNVISNLYHTG